MVIIVRIAGVALFAWTMRSIWKHVKELPRAKANGTGDQQSMGEKALNSVLLYLWLLFMIAFSLGMLLNNGPVFKI